MNRLLRATLAQGSGFAGTALGRLQRAALVSVALAIGSCADKFPPELVALVPSKSAAPELYRPAVETSYVISAGDKLIVNSYYHPDLKQTVTVQPDGRISLLLVGTVMAAGKSPEQFAKELVRAYDKYIADAEITVTVEESAGQAVYVGGDVAKPSLVPLKGELTLLQSITEAGGFLNTANKEQVLIVRQTPDGQYRTLQANAEQILRNEADEIYLRRHDVIYVPKTAIARADQFVDQYINQIIPHAVNAAFAFSYQLQGLPSGGTTIVTPPR